MIDLGLADVRPMPGVAADPERWEAVRRHMHRGVFLRSEGTVSPVDAPQIVSGALLAQAKDVVARLNRFYAGVAAAYYERPELRAEHLVNPVLEPLLALEADQPVATPLSRFDAVLDADGTIRVIELNSVGICLFHMRGLLYLVRALARGGFEDDARRLEQIARDTIVEGFLRFARARGAPERPVVGAVSPSNWMRAGHLLFRGAFQRAGCDYVFGGPEHVEVTHSELRIRGTRIDVLWADFLLYIAYQFSRYQETKFPTKLPDYGQTPAQAAALIADPHFIAHLRERRVVMLSPARSYLALPKSLLSWIHRSDRPVPDKDRAFLATHVARTYSARDRLDGVIALDDILANRGDFLVKPCQYGGSHGVMIGRMASADDWRARVTAIWDDPTWVVQAFHEPGRTTTGEYLSLGIANLDGVFGGCYFRTSPSLLVSARDSLFVPAAGQSRG
jgi:hypothetical protein